MTCWVGTYWGISRFQLPTLQHKSHKSYMVVSGLPQLQAARTGRILHCNISQNLPGWAVRHSNSISGPKPGHIKGPLRPNNLFWCVLPARSVLVSTSRVQVLWLGKPAVKDRKLKRSWVPPLPPFSPPPRFLLTELVFRIIEANEEKPKEE